MIDLGAARLRITAVPAHHSHDEGLDASLGKGNGYLLSWEGAAPYRVYWTGDSILSDDMRQVAARYAGLDLWLPHLGAVGLDGTLGLRTMNAEEAVEAMILLRPRQVIPIHHTTFGHYREPLSAFVQRVRSSGMGDRLTLVDDGETVGLGLASKPIAVPAGQGIQRTLLEQRDLHDFPGWELRQYRVEYAPGIEAPSHSHPVLGTGYVIEGRFESAFGNGPTVIKNQGESFVDEQNQVHRFRNPDPLRPLVFLVSYVVRKGEPTLN